MPRILLPLLLCLSLLTSTVGGAWMATEMAAAAMPETTAQAMEHDCCAGLEAHHHSGGDHEMPATPACDDGGHCDCMQHCQLLPALALMPLAALRYLPPATQPQAARHEVLPQRLNRPPIA